MPFERLPLWGIRHPAAGLVLVGLHPGPEVLRVRAALGRGGGIGLHLAGPVGAVPKDHVAVQVVAFHQRGPLKGNEGGEVARLVELLGRVDELFPYTAEIRIARLIVQRRGQLALGKLADQFPGGFHGPLAAGDEGLMKLASLGIGHDIGRAFQDVGDHAHAVGVVRDHKEVIGPGEPDRLAGIGGHLFTAGEAVTVARHQPGTRTAGIGRQARVNMGVAEIDVDGTVPVGEGGVGPLAAGAGRWLVCRRPHTGGDKK